VPRAGQTGYHHRTEVNKRIMMLGSDGDRLTPAGGFTSYGQVKGDYIVLRGSVMGPAKRLIRIRKLVREAKLPAEVPKVTYLNTEWKKEQGD
jgi:large subunit ribosomal protein L3